MRQIHVITVNRHSIEENRTTLRRKGGYKTDEINITVLFKGGGNFTFIHRHQKAKHGT